MGTVAAACRVAGLHRDTGSVGATAIHKRPVPGPVEVGTYGVRGNLQADRKHHGGPEKALYVFSQAEADQWADELGEDVPPGRFGENLRVDVARAARRGQADGALAS